MDLLPNMLKEKKQDIESPLVNSHLVKNMYLSICARDERYLFSMPFSHSLF
jgi:hypothetical protein